MSNVVPCSGMGLLKTTVDPKRYNTLPPNAYAQPTFSKRIDVVGNILVNDAALTVGLELVPTTSGLIVWLPSQGCNSVYRFGFVSAGKTSTGAAGNLPLGTFASNLTFGAVLALPYNDRVPSDVLTVAPPLRGDSISMARLYAGRLRVVSDTVALTSTSLGGYLTGTATGDIRNIFSPLDSGADSFSPANMVQVATTVNDGIKEVSVAKGIVSVIGPDISPSFNAPNAYETITTGPGTGFQPRTMAGFLTQTQVAPILMAPGQMIVQYYGWVSPWNITNTTPSPMGLGGCTLQNIQKGGALNPFGGCMEFNVNFHISNNVPVVPNPYGYLEEWTVVFSSVYASVSSNGGIYYSTIRESFVVGVLTGALPTFTSAIQRTAKHNPRMRASGGFTSAPSTAPIGTGVEQGGADRQYNYIQGRGMYIGTSISIVTTNIGKDPGNGPPQVINPNGWVNSIACRSVDDGATGELGPCRAIRFDGIGNNSILRVDGLFMAECVPGYTTAPFTQSGETMSRVCENSNTMAFLSFAFNTPESPFQRTYEGPEYDEFIRSTLPLMGTRQLRQFANPGLIRAAAAAGILDEPTCETLENESGTVVQSAKEKRKRTTLSEDTLAVLEDRQKTLYNPGSAIAAPSEAGFVSDRLRNLDRLMEPIERERLKRMSTRQIANGET